MCAWRLADAAGSGPFFRQPVERLLQGDMTVQIVGPVPLCALEPLALDGAADSPAQRRPCAAVAGQRFLHVDGTGQLQGCALPRLLGLSGAVFQMGAYLCDQ